MKRILSIFLALLMLFSAFALASCEKEEDEEEIELDKTEVESLIDNYLEKIYDEDFSSIKCNFKEFYTEDGIQCEENEIYAYERVSENKELSYSLWSEEDYSEEEWTIKENDELTMVEIETIAGVSSEPRVIPNAQTSHDLFRSVRDFVGEDELILCREEIDTWLKTATKKGSTSEICFEGSDEYENIYTITMTFKGENLVRLDVTCNFEGDIDRVLITCEYDIDIDVPEVE